MNVFHDERYKSDLRWAEVEISTIELYYHYEEIGGHRYEHGED